MADQNQNIPQFDKSKFNNSPYVKRVPKPWGYEIHWVPEGEPYMGKILHINKDAQVSLQIHDEKKESWYIINGRAKVIWDNNTGELIETELQPGQGYTTQVGQRHRLVGINDCDIVEVSTPEMGTTFRLDDIYNRGDETEEIRKEPNRGWNE